MVFHVVLPVPYHLPIYLMGCDVGMRYDEDLVELNSPASHFLLEWRMVNG